jgi:hypothetical protein
MTPGKISYFDSGICQSKPDQSLEIQDILSLIKRPILSAKIKAIRAEKDKEKQKALKEKLPYCTWSGQFNSRAKDDPEFVHSGLLALDFDHLENVNAIRGKIELDPFVLVSFISPRGAGLKVIVRIPADKTNHEQNFRTATNYFKSRFNLIADDSGKDLSRACFISHDPDVYCNSKAPIISPTNTPAVKANLDISADKTSPDAIEQAADSSGKGPAPLPEQPIEMLELRGTAPALKVTALSACETIPDGKRNNTLTSWAGKMRHIGLSFDEILAVLIEKNRTCDPPLTQVEVEGIARSVARYEPAPVGLNALDPNVAPLSINLAEVEPQEVTWLWKNFIPSGGATLITGDPGCAKTWIALDTAARLSRGTCWIDGSPVGAPGNTVYLSVEDDASNTIRPRFDILGGDPTRVNIYNSGQPIVLNLSKSGGLERLENEIVKIGNVKLVVVDPIADFSGATNANAADEVRSLLTPLIDMASRLGFALVIIGHLNKNQTMGAIYRAGGSTSGWLGKCRAAFMIFRDVDEPALRHIVALKANLAKVDPPQLEFRLADGQLMAKVSAEQVNLEEHLNPKSGRKPREKESVLDWLELQFNGREEIPAIEIEQAAIDRGFSLSTLNRAKAAGGYTSKKLKALDGKIQWSWVKK